MNQEQADKIVEEMRGLYPWMSWRTCPIHGGARIVVVGSGERGCQDAYVEISSQHPGHILHAHIKLYDPSAIVRLERYGYAPTAAEAMRKPFFDDNNLLDDVEKWRAYCELELLAKVEELRSDLSDAERALAEVSK